MATLTPTSPDSFIISDSDSGDDDSVWAMDLDDDDDAADTPVAPVGPNVTVGRVCARAAAARARALDRARAMARADAYLDLNGEARQAHAARQLRLDHLRRECAALRLSAALVLASAPDAVVADADELLDQGYAADEVLAVVAATEPATAAAARRRWEVDDDEGPPLKSGMDRSATIARGLVRLFFADGVTDYARCAAACDPTHYARDAAALRLSSKLDLPLEIVRLVGEFAVQSPLARFSMLGRADGAVLARLLRPHIDGVVGKLKRTKHFGRVVAVARGAAVALPAQKAPRPKKKKPLATRRWNASSIKRDPRGVARHCTRGKRCFCVDCWSATQLSK